LAEDRKTVELGTITITSVVADSDSAQKVLAFDPTNLTDGIELSDDPIPALRRQVCMLSVMHRSGKWRACCELDTTRQLPYGLHKDRVEIADPG
jgi:hypothetical protein